MVQIFGWVIYDRTADLFVEVLLLTNSAVVKETSDIATGTSEKENCVEMERIYILANQSETEKTI